MEQAVQFSVAAAKVTVTDKEGKEALDKLLLQGFAILVWSFAPVQIMFLYTMLYFDFV